MRALFNRPAECDEELSLVQGQLICVRSKYHGVEELDDGWWLGESYGYTGLFPSMMVEELMPETIFVSNCCT